jgi:NADH:ubiquinone oxidoreductase subunit 3 (subunit A)
MKTIKILIAILVALLIVVVIVFAKILMPEKEEKEINKNPSTIQERKDALKNVFK